MGVVEANPHLDSSSRTVVSLHGSHSEARLGKKPMDVGECSYSPSSGKIKRRLVSAVRDFPPGCGRNVLLNNGVAGTSRTGPMEGSSELEASVGASQSVPTENSVAGDRINDGNEVDDSDMMSVPVETRTSLEDEVSDLQANLCQLSNNSTIVEGASPVGTTDQAEQLIRRDRNDDGQKAVSMILSAGQVGGDSDLMNRAVVGTVETDELTALDHEGSDLSLNPYLVRMATQDVQMVSVMSDQNSASISVSNSGQEKNAARRYPPRRHVSAVRDFPPFCRRNAALEARNFSEEQSDMGDKPSSSKMNTIMQQAGVGDVREEEFHKNELGGNDYEVTGDGVQTERKGHDVEEMERKDECNNGMKLVLEDTRKNEIVPSQEESNECKGTREDGIHSEKKVGKQIVVYHEKNSPGGNIQEDRVIVMGLMAASNCPWLKAIEVEEPKPNGGMSEGKQKKPYGMSGSKRKKPDGMSERKQKKPSAGVSESKQKTLHFECQPEGSNTTPRTKSDSKIGRKPRKTNGAGARETANQGTSQQLVIRGEDAVPISCYTHVSHVCPPPFCQSSSSNEVCDGGAIVTRNKVRETLRLFQAVSRKLLQEDEAKSKEGGTSRKRYDLQAAKILKEKGKYVNVGKQILGAVPGVEVGDEFHYRVELLMIGLHRQIQGGIDYVKHGGKILATSIVASGGYADALDDSNSLIYTGQGGNMINTEKEPEDQKLERGNLALKNSLDEKNPVRVIRGSESSDGKSRTYVYDGLYLVEKCWQHLGPHNKLVYKFHLDRIAGQPELAWKELKKSKKFQVREGICVDDISGGKESIPICAVNTIDDEKPPSFEYITSMIYPYWCRPLPLLGCSCTAACSDSEKCSCAVKNRGEIPYNFNGAIVEAKPLVYECGPTCKCPPSCHNRVSQHGIKFQLEIFKTKSRGWGVRSLNSIPSGKFICEYIGELLEEKEAEARAGNDEYLFDIGNNYNDNLWDGLSSLMPDAHSSSYEVVEEGCFTIDAASKGNLGRFINHSCSPNLYAQNVLYDHEDNRIPHIMFFAAENIPPLQELTYDYNYMIDQVRDSNGNIKKKNCYCGSPECTGRLY
ncbi:PREDICTED: histone-lysine N-methyltransferase, H3 lysine-9 specific SUVH6 [Fragaria vesca subsp. vesca]|uniref:histone-lysine N-methyltransferase, H3 lysine-9 specific SUVH6 n=1 Tax=Fragaria vesca subsp. vesca TaxID=101020 RepID=UPI0002C36917|nr:PREDICTED: histone-lysine N-methyltransferase, H3 lysine-9 specific SUVH6 [Fragaria vesca subsp. vesca]